MAKISRKQKLMALLQRQPSGWMQRWQFRRTLKNLAVYDSADVVPVLVDILLGVDQQFADIAAETLKWMNAEDVKIAIAQSYFEKRNAKLLRVIREGDLVPDGPPQLLVPLLLKLGDIPRATSGGLEIIEPLMASLSDPDEIIRANAELAWQSIDPKITEEVARRYYHSRDAALAELIARFGLIPREPIELGVFIGLKLGRLQELASIGPEMLEHLMPFIRQVDEELMGNALELLGMLENQNTINELCDLFLRERLPSLCSIIVGKRYQPSENFRSRVLIRLLLNMIAQVSREGPEVIPLLLEAQQDADDTIRENAVKTLHGLQNQESINALCQIYCDSYSPRLGTLIKECGYLATEPFSVKIKTLLKQGRHTEVLNEGNKMLDLLIAALGDQDTDIKSNADFTFAAMSRQDLIDEICRRIIRGAPEALAEAAVLNGLSPRDHVLKATFLIATGQLAEFKKFDPRLEYIGKALRESEPLVRQKLIEKIRATSDPRLLSLLR